MKHQYKFLVFILCAILITGCGAGASSTETGQDPFSTLPPESTLGEAVALEEPNGYAYTEPSGEDWGPGVGIANQEYFDQEGSIYYLYEGGEMHLYLWCSIPEYVNHGYGLTLFVDGKPQAYHIPDNPTDRYLHDFYPEQLQNVIELIFVPVAGEKGDLVEFAFHFVEPIGGLNTDFRAQWNTQMDNSGSLCLGFSVRYLETPPQAVIVPTTERVRNLTVTYEDLEAGDLNNLSDPQHDVDYSLKINGRAVSGEKFQYTPEQTTQVILELKGNPDAEFGLVLFYNYEPITVDLDSALYHIQAKQGQKVKIMLEVDVSDFDTLGYFHAVMVPKTHLGVDRPENCWASPYGYWYISSAESRTALRESMGIIDGKPGLP